MALTKQEMQNIVKNFMQNIGTSSLKKKLQLIESVKPIIKGEECPAAVINVIVQSLSATLCCTQYAAAQRAILDLLRAALTQHRDVTVKAMLQTLEKLAAPLQKLTGPSRNVSAQALLAFSWSCLLADVGFLASSAISPDDASWCSVVSIQSLLYHGACAARNKVIWMSAAKKLKNLWKRIGSNSCDLYFDCLVKSAAESNCCGLLGTLASFDPASFEKRKTEYLNLYVKLIVMSKTRPLQGLLDTCGSALKLVTHDDFRSTLAPALQKGLLRSPENVLPTVESVLREVSIDLSQHALTIAKFMTPQLSSKNEKCRDEALPAISAMAVQVSDAGAMEEVVKHFFGVLQGSEGKLTLAGQKIAVLDAIGRLSQCPVGRGQSAVSLLQLVADNFSPYLQQENLEAVLSQALVSLSTWCRKLSSEIPPSLITLFQKGPTLKASTSAIRTGYLECMIASFNTDTLSKANAFLPTLLQAIEKASSQSLQTLVVSEALSSAFLVLKLSLTECKIGEAKMNSFWGIVLDTKKMLFTSEKFFQHASEVSILRLISFSEALLLEHPTKVQDEVAVPYCSAIARTLLHKDWNIRNAAQKSVRKILSSLSSHQLCIALLSALSEILRPSKVIDLEALEDTSEVMKTYITPRRFEHALKCLIDVPGIDAEEKNASEIALKILPDCHHPCIQKVNQNLWTEFLFNARLDAAKFIEDHADHIVDTFVITTCHSESDFKVISDLVRIAPHALMPRILGFASVKLEDPALLTVTTSDYAIMNTPEGELWNKAVVESGPKIAENKNIKRENKAYSYKEQMEFLEIQKEIEAKKSSQGGGWRGKGPGRS